MENKSPLETARSRLVLDEEYMSKLSDLCEGLKWMARSCHDTDVDFDECLYAFEGILHILSHTSNDCAVFINYALKEIKNEIKKGTN